jgi:hydroxymethylpyrimidine/phosphomethylpyrimidine kinase
VRIPTALSVAGSDPSGGAGVQADLKTFHDRRVYGMAVITALTVQNTVELRHIESVSGGLVSAQLAAIFDDIWVDALKIGMVHNEEVIHSMCCFLEERRLSVPIVVDPVMAAKDGSGLLEASAMRLFVERLLPLATLVTPNLPERALLDAAGWRPACPVLTKGGHGGGEWVEDVLEGAEGTVRWRHRRTPSRHTHGTGCTLSAAITAELAKGTPLAAAVARSIRYVSRLIREARAGLGRGNGPLWHGVPAR